MIKKYSYCCLRCWHTWESLKKISKCPKCGSEKIDTDFDIMFEGE